MIGSRRSKSPMDLSAISMATRTEGSGFRRRMDFCKMDFKTGTDNLECLFIKRVLLGALGIEEHTHLKVNAQDRSFIFHLNRCRPLDLIIWLGKTRIGAEADLN
jgi:hypothetical protein